MDALLKKEQIGTHFVWMGAPEGGFGGWVMGQGGPAHAFLQKQILPPDVCVFFYACVYTRVCAYYACICLDVCVYVRVCLRVRECV